MKDRKQFNGFIFVLLCLALIVWSVALFTDFGGWFANASCERAHPCTTHISENRL